MAHPADGRPPQAADPAGTGLSRRDFIQASVGSAIAGGMALQAMAGQQPGLQGTGLRRPRIKDPLLILVNRITQGFSQPTFEIAKQMGYGPFLEWQLDPDAIPDPQVDQFLAQYHSLGLSHQELWEQYTQFGLDNIPEVELKAATIYRSVKSERQLYERMVEFWSNHFNIYHEKDGLKIGRAHV